MVGSGCFPLVGIADFAVEMKGLEREQIDRSLLNYFGLIMV